MKTTVAGIQMDIELARPERNLERMEERLREASSAGARIVVFPECAVTGYCFESAAEAAPFAEPVPGPSIERMAEACRGTDSFTVFGLLESHAGRIYNACVLVGPGGLIGKYRKVHIPWIGADTFTSPGDLPFAAFEAGPVRVGMHICYDGSFPESARVLALEGADLIALPTNWPRGAECTASCVINARALENHVYFMAVNRVGTERGFRFIGRSRICHPTGDTLAEAPGEGEHVLYAEVDTEVARTKHLVRVPGRHEIDRFADRRPDMYGKLVAPIPPPPRPPGRR